MLVTCCFIRLFQIDWQILQLYHPTENIFILSLWSCYLMESLTNKSLGGFITHNEVQWRSPFWVRPSQYVIFTLNQLQQSATFPIPYTKSVSTSWQPSAGHVESPQKPISSIGCCSTVAFTAFPTLTSEKQVNLPTEAMTTFPWAFTSSSLFCSICA